MLWGLAAGRVSKQAGPVTLPAWHVLGSSRPVVSTVVIDSLPQATQAALHCRDHSIFTMATVTGKAKPPQCNNQPKTPNFNYCIPLSTCGTTVSMLPVDCSVVAGSRKSIFDMCWQLLILPCWVLEIECTSIVLEGKTTINNHATLLQNRCVDWVPGGKVACITQTKFEPDDNY
jgi:hypothetical protein